MVAALKPSARAVLATSALLRHLAPEERERLAPFCRVVRAARGETIWSRGDEADFFGLVATGFVKMVRTDASGAEVALEIMGPGQIFGLLGTVMGTGCPLSARAVTDLWYARIPKQPFLSVYDANVVLKERLLLRTARRLHGFSDFVVRLSAGRVEERIASLLLLLAESFGEAEGGRIRIGVPLTRQEIGEMTGTTVESTIRTMSRWQKDGLVATSEGFVTILDEKGLLEMVRGS